MSGGPEVINTSGALWVIGISTHQLLATGARDCFKYFTGLVCYCSTVLDMNTVISMFSVTKGATPHHCNKVPTIVDHYSWTHCAGHRGEGVGAMGGPGLGRAHRRGGGRDGEIGEPAPGLGPLGNRERIGEGGGEGVLLTKN